MRDYAKLFGCIYPGFFLSDDICTLPGDAVFSELVMDLHGDMQPAPYRCEGITFGEYSGDMSQLRDAVSSVEPGWVQFFGDDERVYCAFDGKSPAAFCIIDDMGHYDGLHIGGPGCVGTLPAYRRRGIGLDMVYNATRILRSEGYDLSWIHHTHLEGWYMKAGYTLVLHWNSSGIITVL